MKKLIISIVAALVVVVASVSAFVILSGNGKYTFQVIENGVFEKVVEASGKVTPIREAHLGFEASGTIKSISVDVGDVVTKGTLLVKIDDSSIRSQLSKAEADLEAEIVELNSISSGGLSSELINTKQSVISSLQDAYSTSDGAIKTKTDQFFDYIDSDDKYPEVIKPDKYYNIETSLLHSTADRQRKEIGNDLQIWGPRVRSLTIDTLMDSDVEYTKEQLETVLDFMDNLVKITNNFDKFSNLSTSDVNNYRSLASSARSEVQGAYSDVLSKEESLRSVSSGIPLQQTKVTSAGANVDEYRVQLSKTDIRAPFDGIISQQDAEIGEIAQSGTSLVSMIGSQGLKLEVYVPEVNISGVMLEQDAEVKLDAYGDEVTFDAKVVAIDPTETEKEGISTYKTTFHFNEPDPRIRSGMSADVTILIDRREDVLLLPRRSVVDGYVMVEEDGDIVRKKVEVGDKDSYGNFEVVSGLSSGDKVVLNP